MSNIHTRKVHNVRIFLSSPKDVQTERDIVHKTARMIKNSLGGSLGFTLDVIDFNTHIVPNMGRPQQVINDQIEDYDIFVGVLWKRFGMFTGVRESGTEEEFLIAYENWKQFQRPHILFYFSQVSFIPQSLEEIQQMSRVLEFKNKFMPNKEHPGLVYNYQTVEEFTESLQTHVSKIVLDMFKNDRGRIGGDVANFTPYLKKLKQETMYIDIRGLVTGKEKVDQFVIDDLYIPLKTSYGVSRERELMRDMFDSDTRLEEALKEKKLFIKGDPGAGKTTFLRLIAYTLCQARLGEVVKSRFILSEPLPLPLFVPIGMLSRYIRKCNNLEGFSCPVEADDPQWLIHFLVAQSQKFNWGLSAEHFRTELQKGQCMILLDGLDEAANEDERESISQLASNLVMAYSTCQLVLTSRPAALTSGEMMPRDFQTVEIAALDDEAIENFLDKWCSVLYQKALDKSDEYKDELRGALKSHAEIRRMARTPVMLTALAVVHWNEHRLPDQRAELYESVLTWLFKARKERLDRLPVAQCRELLQKLALSLFTHKKGRLRTADIWEGAKILAPDCGNNQKEADRFLRDEMVDSGVIVERSERLEFWHLSFQEYLTAYEIGGLSDEAQLEVVFQDSRLYKSEWREVMLLLAGVLHKQGKPRINHLIDAIINKGPHHGNHDSLPQLAREVALLGGMVKDLSPYNFEPSHQRYKEIFQSVMGIFDKEIFRSIPVQVRIEAADAMGRVGDHRFDREEELWVTIPGGTFWMGAQKDDPKRRNYDKDADYYVEYGRKESPPHEVKLSAYQIGKYPVTVCQYKEFIEERGYEKEGYWEAGGFGKFKEPDKWEEQVQHPNRPVVGVSWFEAKAYAAWCDCRLPTEAEWERTARGPGQEYHKYTWGNTEPDKERMNYSSNIGHSTPVGIFPESCSPEGVIDMAGNVWEWCEDWYGDFSINREVNPTGPLEGSARVVRGGCWGDDALDCRSACRDGNAPVDRDDILGFRLLRFYS